MASVWDSFKKKLNEEWSGWDFWDKEENRRQQQAFSQPQATPQAVATPQRPQYRQPTQQDIFTQDLQGNDLGLDPFKAKPLDLGGIDKGLDAGKSWEQISRETGIDLNTVKQHSQKTRPDYGIAPKAPQPIQEFTSLERGAPVNKTIFGWNAAGILPKSLEKTRTVTATGTEKATADQFLQGYDRLNEETRQFWLASLDDKAKSGDVMAQNTLKTLQDNGRLKGNADDFISGAADKVRGGIARSTLRTVDFVLPGKNTFGLEELADDLEGPRQVTGSGRTGEKVGSTMKGVIDAKMLVKAGMQADKAAAGTKVVQALDNAADATKALKPVAFVAKTLPGSIAGTAVDIMQEVGRGNDVNIGKSAAIGVGSDLATPIVLKGAGKVIKRLMPEKLVDAGKDQIARLLTDNADEVVEKAVKEASVTPPVSAGVGAVEGKTQSIGDLLPNLARRNQPLNLTEELSKKYGVSENMVKRLQEGYGDDVARSIMARNSDATNIRDMDAFVWSQAKKNYGDPKPRLSPEDEAIQARLNERPENLRTIEQSTEQMSDAERLALTGGDTGQAGLMSAPAGTRKFNPVTGKIETIAPQPAKAESRLGSMVDDFYQKVKEAGNTQVKYGDLQRLGEQVSKQVNDDFAAIGSDYATVSRKVQEGVRNGARTLDEAGLSPDEAMVLRKAQAEMNHIRRRASLGKKEVSSGDFGEMYLPQQKVGQYDGDYLFKGFRENKPGSEFIRKNKIDLEDLDYSADVIGQYITRYGDTRQFNQQRLANALFRNNPTLDDATINKAAERLIDIQDKVNAITTKIGKGGLGKRVAQADGKFVDVAREMNDVGKLLGHNIQDVVGTPKGLTNGDRLNSVMVGDKTLADFLGLNQHRDAVSYAASQIKQAGGDRTKLALSVQDRLMKDYDLTDDDIEYAVRGIGQMAENLPDEVVQARVQQTYKQAAKQQLMTKLQDTNVVNDKLRKDVSDMANQILREGSIEHELSSKIVKKTLQTTNALFRKFNISSALNEFSDLNSFAQRYGTNLKLIPDFNAVKEFGLGDIDAAIEPYIRQMESGKSVGSILRSINNATNLYRFVEHYKAGVIAKTARDFYSAKGLTGDALTKAVLSDYRDMALPVDAFTKTFLDDYPLYTQYMTWGARNLQKEGRLAMGKMGGGVLENMSQKQRIARNMYVNLPAKTVFWLASNGLKGTAILTAFGLTDFTGLTSQDYSGIAEEDKSLYDKAAQFTNISTIGSLLNTVVQSWEKEQLKEKYKDADYNPYEHSRLDKDIMDLLTPQVAKNVSRTHDMQQQGYSENKSGRVQYEAADDFWNKAKGYMFGKGQTENAREYSGRQGIVDRIQRGDNIIEAIADMAREDLGLKDRDYTRPLTDDYSKAYKEADEGARKAWLQGGRQYNEYLDNLKKDSPEQYNNYIAAMKDHVNPEYWNKITEGGKDLTTFKMMAERKKQYAKDFKKAYDPIYDLNDEQARAVLQQKSTATGDDIALRNSLYKEQWYKEYMDKVRDFYGSKTDKTDSDYKQTERVKNWYELSDQYNGLRALTTDDGKEPEWAKSYPLVYQQKRINDKYGFDSDESKNFFRANGDGYKAQKEQYDAANLDLINKMREIEGYPPMSAEQYAQVTKIADTDGDSKKGSGSGSGGSSKGGGVKIASANFGQKRALNLPSAKIKVSNVKIKKSQPKTVKIQRNKKA